MEFNRTRTAAYHPAANRVMGRFYGQLKAFPRAQLSTDPWVDNLSFILLGICSSFFLHINYTVFNLVYGTTSRLPADIITSSSKIFVLHASAYTHQLRKAIPSLRPVLMAHNYHTTAFLHPVLQTSTNVFVRKDAVRMSLQLPCNKLCLVLRWAQKFSTVSIHSHEKIVWIDLLKPPFISSRELLSSSTAPTSADHSPLDTLTQPIKPTDLPCLKVQRPRSYFNGPHHFTIAWCICRDQTNVVIVKEMESRKR